MLGLIDPWSSFGFKIYLKNKSIRLKSMNGRILKRCVNPEGAKKESKTFNTKYKTLDKIIKFLFKILWMKPIPIF